MIFIQGAKQMWKIIEQLYYTTYTIILQQYLWFSYH